MPPSRGRSRGTCDEFREGVEGGPQGAAGVRGEGGDQCKSSAAGRHRASPQGAAGIGEGGDPCHQAEDAQEERVMSLEEGRLVEKNAVVLVMPEFTRGRIRHDQCATDVT